MQTRTPQHVAFLVSGFLAFSAVVTPSQAFTVHDPVQTIETIKGVNEAAKAAEQLKLLMEKATAISGALNGTAAIISNTASMSRALKSAQCLIPDLSKIRLPDGLNAKYTDLCTALKASRSILMPSEGGVTFDGEPISQAQNEQLTRRRRDQAVQDATLNGFAAAKADQQAVRQTHDVAAALIAEANGAVDVLSIERVNAKILVHLLIEQANTRALLASLLELQAASSAQTMTQIRISDQFTATGDE